MPNHNAERQRLENQRPGAENRRKIGWNDWPAGCRIRLGPAQM
ncbi:hypothetical protein [Methylomonas sp. MgM2]